MPAGAGMTARTALAQHRITLLATQLPVHRAFGWIHLHQPQLRAWQMEFLAIAAPTFEESTRAEWFRARFEELGLARVAVDAAGNVTGELPGTQPELRAVLLSAHLDTVFPAGTAVVPREEGARIVGPGSCDNGAGLAGLLAIAAALRHGGVAARRTIVFAANTGEEGEGDLRGMRHLLGWQAAGGEYAGRVAAALALEGAGTTAAVTRGLGSRRFRVTIEGPGGHSWTDAGAPNPITLVGVGLARLAGLAMLNPGAETEETRTTFSPGRISGGTSVNSIPARASVDLDLRSTDAELLERLALEVHRTFEYAVAESGRRCAPFAAPTLRIETIGSRPAAALAEDAGLLDTLRAVDRHLGLRTELRVGSTDANVPLALGLEAAALAAGGVGFGIHTLGEWYDPTGREMALRRVLLTLLDVANGDADHVASSVPAARGDTLHR